MRLRERVDALYLADEREAWERYLRDTHDCSSLRYDEVERWAWRRLKQQLKAAQARQKARR